jgi:FAD/FMN-containing dehydrogenase
VPAFVSGTELRELGTRIEGDLVRPDDSGWEAARQAWNLAVDQHPAAVALVAGAEDVAAVIAFAREHEMQVAAQGTGHGADPLGSLERVLLVKTGRLDGIEIDADAARARIGAGVIARELASAAQAKGLSSLPGSSPDVGVVGFTLGGGLGWLG